jgi:hypothetical protein
VKNTPLSIFALSQLKILRFMRISYNDAGVFTLQTTDGTFLGKLEYEKWGTFKASMTTQFADFYEFKTKGFWGTRIAVTTGGEEFAEITMSWKGELVIDLANDDTERSYVLRHRSLWKTNFELENRWGNKLFVLTPNMNWLGNHNYSIEINPDFQDFVKEDLILMGVYCANYYMKMIAGGA